jgi:outer membrane protein TolC
MVQVDDAVKESKASLRRAASTREAREYAEAALAAEEDKFRAGTSTVFLVLQLQRNLTAARSAEISALADYNKSISNLSLREGTILLRNKVDVQVK